MGKMKNSKGRRKPPSRARYERKTRIFSARLPIETYEKILENLTMWNMSKADALKVLAGEMAIKCSDIEKIKQQVYDQGWQAGVDGAVETFAILYPCSRCGKETFVDRNEEKKIIKEFICKQGWVCDRCSG